MTHPTTSPQQPARAASGDAAPADSAIAAHIHAAQPSEAARTAARLGVLDLLAVTLPVTWRLVVDSGLDKIIALFGADDAASTALRLGYQAHALDFDDIYPGLRGHPSAVVLPALLALVKHRDQALQVDEFLDAYVIGVELCARIAAATGERHYPNGFHATATIGCIAAAGAAAWLLKLDIAAIDNALGLAATRAAGLRAQFGSFGKPLHAAMAARTGVESALLARAGFTGAAGVLDAFVDTFGAGAAQPRHLAANWGANWGIVTPGLSFKRYPTCGGTHGAADAALVLRDQLIHQFGVGEPQIALAIKHIVVSFPEGADIAPCIRTPLTGVEARFSLEYVIAAALIHGRLPLELFAEGPVNPAIEALAARVTRKEDTRVPHDSLNPTGRFHDVSVQLADGRAAQQRITRDDVLAGRYLGLLASNAGAFSGKARSHTGTQAVDLQGKLRESLRKAPEAQVEAVLKHAGLHTLADIDGLLDALRERASPTHCPTPVHRVS